MQPTDSGKSSLSELAKLFLKLGTIGFGGPAAHIAMMEDEVVYRRRWLTHEKFLDLLGATQLIPGPNSTEMAIHIGYLRAGWPGLIVAGSCFILPAVIIVLAIAWVYVAFGTLPEFSRILWGIKPVIIAIILQALARFGRAALKTRFIIVVSLATLILNLMGVHELILLLGAAFVGAITVWSRKQNRFHLLLPGMPLAASYATASFSVSGLFLFFLKVGSVLFGSGYVLIAFLRADLVERWHWLTDSQLIDAITVGQITPGPVFTTATFIGYLLGRWNGAAAATIGIFLPAFIFVAISGPLIPRIRKSIVAGAALDCINAASLGLMSAVTWKLATSVLIEPVPVVLFLVSLAGLVLFKLNSVWLILAGAVVGSLSSLFSV